MTTIQGPRVGAAESVPVAASLVGAAAAGTLAGIGTCYLQGHLPADWFQLANSGAVWTVIAFAVALVCPGPRWSAVTAGGLALVGEVAGYYAVAAPVRGIPTTHAEQMMWGVAALWIGPAAGFAAWCVRRGLPPQRVVAALALAGVLAGEGAYQLHCLGYVLFGRTEIVTAAAVGAVTLVCSRAGWGARLLAVGAAVAVAVSTYAVYAQTVLM